MVTMSRNLCTLSLLGAMYLAGPLAMAQTTAGTPSGSQPSHPVPGQPTSDQPMDPNMAMSGASMAADKDTRFVKKASAAGATEIAASQLAQSHAASAATKTFATTMINDHGKAGEQLKQLAGKNGVTPSDGPTPAQQAAIARLGKLDGAAFDKAYASMMVKDHHEAVALFKQESTSGKNADFKAFASETLPTLQGHLSMAEKLK